MNVFPTVVYTRPRDWHAGGYTSDRLNMVYVAISGDFPKKRNGRPVGDGIGDVISKTGVEILYNAVKKYQPQIFFHSIHAKVDSHIMMEVKRLSPNTKIVVMDGNDPHKMSKYVSTHRKFIDAVLLNSKDLRTKQYYYDAGYPKECVGTLYDGFIPAEHPVPKITPKFDCFFGGSNLREPNGTHRFENGLLRYKFMTAIKSNFALDLHGLFVEWGFKTAERLNYPAYYTAFHNAKIALNVNHLELRQYYTRRTIHSGSSGRMYILKYIPGMEEDFGDNREHAAWFSTIGEGVELVREYLLNNKKREETASKCYQLFLQHHSWQARLKEFEDFVYSIV